MKLRAFQILVTTVALLLQVSTTSAQSVRCLALQSDGKILVGGNFETLTGLPSTNIARLNASGSLDAGFRSAAEIAELDSSVNSVAVLENGAILVGGLFPDHSDEVNTYSYLARLNPNGSLDEELDANGVVWSLARKTDGKILAGGAFNMLGGQTCNYLGLLNADGSFNSGFGDGSPSGQVLAIAAQTDGKILIGGAFTMVSGVTRHYIARYHAGGFDFSFNPDADGFVSSFAVQADGKILVGGSFSSLGGKTHNGIGRLNPYGSVDGSFNPPAANHGVSAIALQANGKILVGAETLTGFPPNKIFRLYSDGSVDSSFNAVLSGGGLSAIVVQGDGRILIGGNFAAVNGQSRDMIARLNPDGSLDSSCVGITNCKSYRIDWFTLSGGGGSSRGQNYSVMGTLGQPFAGVWEGDNYTAVGGFWSLFAALPPRGPRLWITRANNSSVLISWPNPSTGFQLQETPTLGPAAWSAVSQTPAVVGDQMQVAVSVSLGSRFYRVCKPQQ